MTWTEDDFLLLALAAGLVVGGVCGWAMGRLWR